MYASQIRFLPIPKSKILMYSRNYIPHRTPLHTNFNLWKQVYNDYLLDIYNIFACSVNEKYDTNVDWDDENIFDQFCRFVFECSSKYINKDLKDEVLGFYDSESESDN